jgi:acyl-CoA synthetase (AMP-forming)/AMP-acid ligase II
MEDLITKMTTETFLADSQAAARKMPPPCYLVSLSLDDIYDQAKAQRRRVEAELHISPGRRAPSLYRPFSVSLCSPLSLDMEVAAATCTLLAAVALPASSSSAAARSATKQSYARRKTTPHQVPPPATATATTYRDNWFDKLAIGYLSRNLQEASGTYAVRAVRLFVAPCTRWLHTAPAAAYGRSLSAAASDPNLCATCMSMVDPPCNKRSTPCTRCM